MVPLLGLDEPVGVADAMNIAALGGPRPIVRNREIMPFMDGRQNPVARFSLLSSFFEAMSTMPTREWNGLSEQRC